MANEHTRESTSAMRRGYGEANDYDEGGQSCNTNTSAAANRTSFDEGAASVASGRSFGTADDNRSRKSRSRSRGYDVAEIRHHQGRRQRGDEDNRSTSSRGYSNSHSNKRRSVSESFDRYCERNHSRGRGFSQDRSISRGRFGGGGTNNNPRNKGRSRSRSQGRGGGGGGGGDPRSPRQSRSRGRSRSNDVRGGRSQSTGRSNRRRRSRSQQQQQKPEWPPCFEDDGTAYVFDPRSSMFYCAESDFFFDPKSKLYFGNKKQAYFQYDDSVDPPFVVVQSTESTTTTSASGHNDNNGVSGTGVGDAAAQGSASSSTTDPSWTIPTHAVTTSTTTIDPVVVSAKPSIAIKLKTKKIGNKKKTSTEASPAPFKVKKELVNIEKWTEKQAELKHGIASGAGTAGKPPSSEMPSTAAAAMPQKQHQKGDETVRAPSPLPPVKFTSKGEPICVICKRKFPTIEKLRLHERISDLHKQNLAKMKLKQQEEVASAAPNNKRKETPKEESSFLATTQHYEDRAQKRRARDLHCPPSTGGGIPSRVAGNVVMTETSRRQSNLATDALGHDNVGHQLLRKLGWDGGGGGGSDTNVVAASYAAATVTAAAGRGSGSHAENIRKEWDAIEAKAAANAGGGPPSRQGL